MYSDNTKDKKKQYTNFFLYTSSFSDGYLPIQNLNQIAPFQTGIYPPSKSRTQQPRRLPSQNAQLEISSSAKAKANNDKHARESR